MDFGRFHFYGNGVNRPSAATVRFDYFSDALQDDFRVADHPKAIPFRGSNSGGRSSHLLKESALSRSCSPYDTTSSTFS